MYTEKKEAIFRLPNGLSANKKKTFHEMKIKINVKCEKNIDRGKVELATTIRTSEMK
jgi:hypothetical protein